MEILHTYIVSNTPDGFGFAGLFITVIALSVGLFAWSCFDDKRHITGSILALIAAVILVFPISMVYTNVTGGYDEKRYEARITDMSAFDTEKYEIVEQRGKLFVVREIKH